MNTIDRLLVLNTSVKGLLDAGDNRHEIGAPRFAVWNSESRDRGKGDQCHTVKPKRGKPSLVESYVTPSPGVGWLQARGRSNTREASLPSDTTLALSVQT